MKTRGHRVIFFTNDYYESKVRDAGLEFRSIGTREQQHFAYGPDRKWPGPSSTIEDMLMSYVVPNIGPAFDYVCDLHTANPDGLVVVSTTFINGAKYAAEYLGIPCVTISLSPHPIPTREFPYLREKRLPLTRFLLRKLGSLKWFVLDRMTRRLADTRYIPPSLHFFNTFRKEKGLPFHSFFDLNDFNNRFLHICMFPEWFGMRPYDWPESLEFVGFPLHDPVDLASRVTVDRFIARYGKPLLVTNGTGNQDVEPYFTEAFLASRQLDVPVIFTGAKKAFEALPTAESCIYVDFVDFAHVLPQCLAVIHHGGMGTIAQALRAGLPQIVRPVVFDQPDNAKRLQALGLAEHIAPKDFKADRVAAALARIRAGGQRTEETERYGRDVRDSTALNDACDLIERACLPAAAARLARYA